MEKMKISSIIKKSVEKQLKDNLDRVDGFIIIGYSGVSAPALSTLRCRLNESKADMLVVKNSLSKRVFKDKKMENMVNSVEGPTGIIFIEDEPVSVSKVLVNFAKENTTMALKGGFLQERLLTKADIEALSKLPPMEVLRAKAVYAIKAPLNNLYAVLTGVLRKPLYALKAISDKKQGQN